MAMLSFLTKGGKLLPKVFKAARHLIPGLLLGGTLEDALADGGAQVQSSEEVISAIRRLNPGEYDRDTLISLIQCLVSELPYDVMYATVDEIDPEILLRVTVKALTSDTLDQEDVDKLQSVFTAACIASGQAEGAASLENLGASLLLIADGLAGRAGARTREELAADLPNAISAITTCTQNSTALTNENFLVVATAIFTNLSDLLGDISEDGKED